jgi:hypothetical protein
MASPKSSWVGKFDLVADLYSANEIRKFGAEFSRLETNTIAGTRMTLSAIGDVGGLVVGSMHMIQECDRKLDTLTKISWDIASYFDRKEQQDAYIADMRYAVHTMSRVLDQIDSFTEDHPEYALYQLDRLIEMIEEKDVRVEHFAKPPQVPEDMRLAQEMLDRVVKTKINLLSILEGSDGD